MTKINEIKELARGGFFHVLTGGVLAKLVAFVSSLLVVRILSQQDYAVLSYVDNIYGYLYLFAGLGFASGILKFCIASPEKNNAYFRFALKAGLGFQLIVSGAIALLFQLGTFPLAGIDSIGTVLMFYPCAYYVIAVVESMLRANEQNKDYARISLLQVVVVMLLIFPLASLFGVMGVAGARYIAAVFVLLVAWHVLRGVKGVDSPKLSKKEKAEFVSFSVSLLAANLFSMLMPLNESFLVNNLLGDVESISGYRVAALIPSQVTFITSAVMIYFTPKFARLGVANAWGLSKRVALLNGLLVVAIAGVGCVLTPLIIIVFYGEEYVGITGLSMMLWAANSANAILRMVPLNIIPMLGYPRFNLILSVASCIFHFIVDSLFIIGYGITGAALASIATYCISAGAYWAFLWRITHPKQITH